LGPLTDYVTLDVTGVASVNTMAHEIGACVQPVAFGQQIELDVAG
jgi:hypothetical protein